MTPEIRLVCADNTPDGLLEKLHQIKARLEFDEDTIAFLPESVRADVIAMIARWQRCLEAASPQEHPAVIAAIVGEATLVTDALKAATDGLASRLEPDPIFSNIFLH